MKKSIGLILLILSMNSIAGTSGVLVLRARVPASYKIEIEQQGKTFVPVIHSNRARVLPKVTMSTKNNVQYVSVVHP